MTVTLPMEDKKNHDSTAHESVLLVKKHEPI